MRESRNFKSLKMRRSFFILIVAMLVSTVNTMAQDVITLKNGDEIKAKVTEISASEIKYKRFENLDSTSIIIPIADVFFINYENGMREIINPAIEPSTEQPKANIPQNNSEQPFVVEEFTPAKVTHKEKNKKPQPAYNHTKFYLGATAGTAPRVKQENAKSFLYGLNFAYFFNYHSGLGVAFRHNWGSEGNYKNVSNYYDDYFRRE